MENQTIEPRERKSKVGLIVGLFLGGFVGMCAGIYMTNKSIENGRVVIQDLNNDSRQDIVIIQRYISSTEDRKIFLNQGNGDCLSLKKVEEIKYSLLERARIPQIGFNYNRYRDIEKEISDIRNKAYSIADKVQEEK